MNHDLPWLRRFFFWGGRCPLIAVEDLEKNHQALKGVGATNKTRWSSKNGASSKIGFVLVFGAPFQTTSVGLNSGGGQALQGLTLRCGPYGPGPTVQIQILCTSNDLILVRREPSCDVLCYIYIYDK